MKNDQKITKDINIEELITKFPVAVEILMNEGIGCLGCAIAHQETLEQGLLAHGKTKEDTERIVNQINESIA